VLIAMPHLSRERLLHVIASCEGCVASIRLVPDMFGLATLGVETEDLDGLLLLHMRWNLAQPWNLGIKRVFDLAVSALLFVLLSPFLALIALLIKLDSPGPVLFRQERVGRLWMRFSCLKFRTMYADNAERLARHLDADPDARSQWEEFAKLKSNDPRVTRIGRWLRRTSLDELPQLFNVFRGEMSLVGPRPYLPRELERMGDFGDTIVKAPPGISGLWQVSGRNDLPFPQRLRLDEYYVRNWSLWLDVIVLLKTLGVVLRGAGAY
jgi:undecaprenyl-phosphate galactose phosphotransferase